MYIKEKWEIRNGEVFFRVISYYESEEAYNNGDAPIFIEEDPDKSGLTMAQFMCLADLVQANLMLEGEAMDYDI